MARRDIGKLTFLDLVDRSGRIQLIVAQETRGRPRPRRHRRRDRAAGEDAPRRAVARRSSEVELLAKIRTPLPDTFHGVTDVETRYRQRYLDLLMNEESRELAAARAKIVAAMRAYLDGEGFVEVETPILQPRYGGAFAEPVRDPLELPRPRHVPADRGRALPQAADRRRAREGLRALARTSATRAISYKHSPEFTQLEWYEAYADYRDTMERIEALVAARGAGAAGTTKVTFRGHELDLAPPWERVKFVEALEAQGVWSRDEDELRAKLDEAGVDTSATRRGRSSPTTRTRTSSSPS